MNTDKNYSDKDYLSLFRTRLIELQERYNMSSRCLSTGVGASPNYIHGIISGDKNPSLTKSYEICEYLEIPPKVLFEFGTAQEEKLSRLSDNAARLSPDELDYFIQLMEGFLILKERNPRNK